jgi:hypothetical protein
MHMLGYFSLYISVSDPFCLMIVLFGMIWLVMFDDHGNLTIYFRFSLIVAACCVRGSAQEF